MHWKHSPPFVFLLANLRRRHSSCLALIFCVRPLLFFPSPFDFAHDLLHFLRKYSLTAIAYENPPFGDPYFISTLTWNTTLYGIVTNS